MGRKAHAQHDACRILVGHMCRHIVLLHVSLSADSFLPVTFAREQSSSWTARSPSSRRSSRCRRTWCRRCELRGRPTPTWRACCHRTAPSQSRHTRLASRSPGGSHPIITSAGHGVLVSALFVNGVCPSDVSVLAKTSDGRSCPCASADIRTHSLQLAFKVTSAPHASLTVWQRHQPQMDGRVHLYLTGATPKPLPHEFWALDCRPALLQQSNKT